MGGVIAIRNPGPRRGRGRSPWHRASRRSRGRTGPTLANPSFLCHIPCMARLPEARRRRAARALRHLENERAAMHARGPDTVTSAPLHALLLSDGKPGHHRQAEGILAALARLRPVSTTSLTVRRRWLVPSRTLAACLNLGAPASLVLRVGYG